MRKIAEITQYREGSLLGKDKHHATKTTTTITSPAGAKRSEVSRSTRAGYGWVYGHS